MSIATLLDRASDAASIEMPSLRSHIDDAKLAAAMNS